MAAPPSNVVHPEICIPLDKWTNDVTVGHVETASQVWVSLQETQYDVQDKVEACKETLPKLGAAEVVTGKMCAAVFSEDGETYRAVILNVGKEEVEVRFCDYGNKEAVKKSDLLKLPEELEKTPPAAIGVYLEGTEGLHNDEKNRKRIESKLTNIDGLQVKLTRLSDGTISARFAVNNKKIKLNKDKDGKEPATSAPSQQKTMGPKSDPPPDAGSKFEVTEEATITEIVKPVKAATSSGQHPTMCSQLPSLKLLDKVQTLGAVVHVSAIGTVWFTPNWILAALEVLNGKIDQIHHSNGMKQLTPEDVCIGLLCIARHSDGYLYRARVVDQMKNSVCSVKFIDYGDNENVPVTSLHYFPAGLEMMAPGAAEIVLANPPPSSSDIETILRDTLLNEESLVLVMEEDQSGVKVGKFLKDGQEITWDGLTDARAAFNKDGSHKVTADDVVIESEVAKQPAKAEELEPKMAASKESKSSQPNDLSKQNLSKNTDENKDVPLIKQVPPIPLPPNEPTRVFVVSVESVTKVWVVREDDEEKLNGLMATLEEIKKDLTPSKKWRPGAVFGCEFSEDEGFYRAAVVEKEGTNKARVQFIDFGNYEVKLLSDLLIIPKEVAKEVSFAVCVVIKNSLEDTEENRAVVEEKLGEDKKLTVTVVDGIAEFAVDGKKVKFQETNPLAPDVKIKSVCVTDQKTTTPESLDVSIQRENSHCLVKDVKVTNNSHEESSKPMKLKEPCAESEKEVRKAGKIFSDAIANLKTQDHKSGSPKPSSIPTAASNSSPDCPWKKGDAVVVRAVTGVWQKASVLEVRPDRVPGVLVSSPGSPPMWKRTKDIRSSCVPLDALNLIEKDLNSNVRPQGDGEVAETPKSCLPLPNVVGKVRDWMDKNIDIKVQTPGPPEMSPNKFDSSKGIPQGPKLVTYIQNSAGSNHVQAVLSTSNLHLAREILKTLLRHSGAMSLMTGSKSSYVIQKLISVLPSSELEELHQKILDNLTPLSLDKVGCRVVQFLLEFSSSDQQTQIVSRLADPRTLVKLATNPHGTYVAQACLPHLSRQPDLLQTIVMSVAGRTVELAQDQSGTFFLQRLMGVLAHHPDTISLHLMMEDIIRNISQLVVTEPGSRFVQVVIKNSSASVLLRVTKWMEEHLDELLTARPAVFLAMAVIDKIEDLMATDGSWRMMLEDVFCLMLTEKSENYLLLISAAYHPCGHLFVQNLVTKLNLVSEAVKHRVLLSLGADVDNLSRSKHGMLVLKGLENVIN